MISIFTTLKFPLLIKIYNILIFFANIFSPLANISFFFYFFEWDLLCRGDQHTIIRSFGTCSVPHSLFFKSFSFFMSGLRPPKIVVSGVVHICCVETTNTYVCSLVTTTRILVWFVPHHTRSSCCCSSFPLVFPCSTLSFLECFAGEYEGKSCFSFPPRTSFRSLEPSFLGFSVPKRGPRGFLRGNNSPGGWYMPTFLTFCLNFLLILIFWGPRNLNLRSQIYFVVIFY